MPKSDPAWGGAGTRKARHHVPAPHSAAARNRRPTHTDNPGNSTGPISKRNVATGGRS